MNEFTVINNYLKPLAKKNSNSLNLSDDIYYDNKKNLAISTDSFIEGVHFIKSSRPKKFLKKILRASLSDLYCKGVVPQSYFLSLSLSKKYTNDTWLKEFKNVLLSEQNKFNIFLGGGDIIKFSKLIVTITVIGFAKSKIVLRKGSLANDDIYVTGNIGDPFLGLCVIKKKKSFGSFNQYFIKSYYEPNLAFKISPHLYKFANASIDISDGIIQDLQHVCKASKCGAIIDLNILPLSIQTNKILLSKKAKLKNIFSHGDDYQILFTAKHEFRYLIDKLSKKLRIKVSRIGLTTNDKNIYFKHNSKKYKISATNMGYTHTF